MESYITVKHAASFEFEDRKSVFIADAAPVSTEREAIEFIATVKKRYPDAKTVFVGPCVQKSLIQKTERNSLYGNLLRLLWMMQI